ncbi:hypothetical protein [Pedobacter cryoconitis]|nr:hypothetical protein [Pedobacter cryoconitis]
MKSVRNSTETFYSASKTILGKLFTVSGKTAKIAAMALDIKLIENGLAPINVLKKSNKITQNDRG